jgi:hypothetical protein
MDEFWPYPEIIFARDRTWRRPINTLTITFTCILSKSIESILSCSKVTDQCWLTSTQEIYMLPCRLQKSWNGWIWTYLFKVGCEISFYNSYSSLSNPKTESNQYWCHMKKHGRDPIRARSHDPWVERGIP